MRKGRTGMKKRELEKDERDGGCTRILKIERRTFLTRWTVLTPKVVT
jgi:hypothetical protein